MANDVDETVSRVYREIADEGVPEHLNKAILTQARKAARPRYARSRAWTRPLAWAATIALSVAIVLEVSQLPAPDEALLDVAAPRLKRDAMEADERFDAPAETLEEELPAAIAPGRASNLAPQSPEPQLPEKHRLMHKTAAKPEPEFEERKRESAGTLDDDRAEAVRMQGFAMSSSISHCAEEQMQEPSTWLECIEQLEAAGLSAEASEQRRLLRETFPDFELP
jgi:hypothetical protein